MVLYVNADANYQTGWYGYDFKITPANGRVLKWENGAFTNFAQAEVNLGEAELQLSVAKDVLAQGGLQSPITLDFKWADNFPENGEPQQFIDQGRRRAQRPVQLPLYGKRARRRERGIK